MEQNLHSPEIYDFRQHDRLWQRVNPALEPYPETAAETIPARGGQIAQPPASSGSLTAAQESQLPGAEPNPCCMGTEAAELLAVLEGYIEEEAGGSAAVSDAVPAGAGLGAADPAGDRGGRGRPRPAAAGGPVSHHRAVLPPQRGAGAAVTWGTGAAALRQCYHEEACGGFNYARTADGTADVCLAKLLRTSSVSDEYRHAEQVMGLLERSLSRRIFC